ncbi:MAG TPA: sulfotransferase [Rhodanobacteraceae bacterium]
MNMVHNGPLERAWGRVERYLAQGQFDAARTVLESLITRVPGEIQARLVLSSVLLKQGHLRAACTQLLETVPWLGDDVTAIHRLVYCLHQVGETAAMRNCLDHPAIEHSRDSVALVALAHMHQLLGAHERALGLMNRAASMGLRDPDFRYFRSLQLQFNGRLQEAETELEACLQAGPNYGRAWLALARMHKQTAEHNHLEAIAAQSRRVEQGSEHHAALEFARFKELDDLGRRAEAWNALQRANAIMHARVPHDSMREARIFDALIETFDVGLLQQSHAASSEGARPIFIVGMPRSGTTLLERILGNHSQVASPGELQDFPKQLRWTADLHGTDLLDEALLERAESLDYELLGNRYLEQTRWRATGKRAFVDKLPPNFMLAGFIHRALPDARILHMRRDPMDVCYSNWKAMFGDSYAYSYQFGTLAAHYRQYTRLMAHWNASMPGVILDIDYARLVHDPEAVAREVFAFCDLPHEPGCTEIARNRNPVSTISSPQVRDAIHRRALGEWQRFESEMRPLLSALQLS